MTEDPGPYHENFIILYLIILVVLLFLSAFFSMTETAFTSFNKIRMENLSKDHKSAKAVLKISENYDRVLSTILIGNNLVNIATASIAATIFIKYFGEIGTTISTVVVTIVVLIFGEVTPKSLAKEKPETFARLNVYLLYGFYYLFYPLALLISLLQNLIKKVINVGKPKPMYTEEEFSMLVEDLNEARVLNDIEEDIIQNTIEYGDTKVEDIMTKAKDVKHIKASDSLDNISKTFIETNKSRLVVCKNQRLDSAYGIIHEKDFFEFRYNNETDLNKIVIDDVVIAKPTNKISRLFKKMQSKHQHMAFIKDDNKFLGIVTMEDIIEELMGEIKDENDDE